MLRTGAPCDAERCAVEEVGVRDKGAKSGLQGARGGALQVVHVPALQGDRARRVSSGDPCRRLRQQARQGRDTDQGNIACLIQSLHHRPTTSYVC